MSYYSLNGGVKMINRNMLEHAHIAYLRLSEIFDVQPTSYPSPESFESFYRIMLLKLGVLEQEKIN